MPGMTRGCHCAPDVPPSCQLSGLAAERSSRVHATPQHVQLSQLRANWKPCREIQTIQRIHADSDGAQALHPFSPLSLGRIANRESRTKSVT